MFLKAIYAPKRPAQIVTQKTGLVRRHGWVINIKNKIRLALTK
ncbi:hypothetical protein X474_01720 [Dethiosulfatarculus sandiegensis]|uniref:Uncharacterized protein n=1 Tax=Dethiosulfatarculus sandiegensis TaxID=1429043 RepID=A0A0D2I0V7_9BACT|nr:hypothetical protein X474_01720 [Dethiosulfatarculus sandiegensis]